jgi:hypothetical protein
VIVERAGDLDHDGCDDLLAGTVYLNTGASQTGFCTAYSSRTGAVLFTIQPQPSGHLSRAAALGDLDGDGTDDLVATDIPWRHRALGLGRPRGRSRTRAPTCSRFQFAFRRRTASAGDVDGGRPS